MMNTSVRWALMLVVLSLLACKRGGADKSETTSNSSNGKIAVKQDHDQTTFEVGTAYAIPQKWEDGNLYTFWIYNDGVQSPPCTKELFPDKPLGGNNWGVTIEMAPIGDPVRATDKNKVYPKTMVRSYYVPREGQYKGDVFNGQSIGDSERSNLTIVSVDGDMISAKIEALEDDGQHVKGEFKAKICTPK